MAVINPQSRRFFSETLSLNDDETDDILCEVERSLPTYEYDQYRGYPAKNGSGWQKYFIMRQRKKFQNPEWLFFCEVYDDTPYVLGCRVPTWDEEHFGFKMAMISAIFLYNEKPAKLAGMIDRCLLLLRERDIKFVSARFHGDHIIPIHLCESRGFRYYENIIWPVASCKDILTEPIATVRLMQASDLEDVLYIAANYQHQQGHYHSDERFDQNKVDTMYVKWVNTAWSNNDPIAVIEHEGKVAGYFVFCIEKELSHTLGYQYYGMRLLCLDLRVRGKGLGSSLFRSTMSLMKQMGADYIDSGYASKNHISARLHVQNSFYSAYEEVTLHLWL